VPGPHNSNYFSGALYNGPKAPHLDRFFFSPVHYSLVLYAVLIETGRLAPEGLEQFNADGSTVEYGYNDAGLLASISRNGAVTSIEYSGDEGFRAVAKVTLPDGSVRSYDTPRSPREIRVTRRDGATLYTAGATGLVESITDASGNRTSFVYDGAGRRTRVTNGAGETIRFEYDAPATLGGGGRDGGR
jgi:YD repeat-containing protein